MTSELAAGTIIAERYELLSEFETGPAFDGFRAMDREVEVHVALWRMRPELFASEAEKDAFLGVVVDVRALVHPNLRRLHEAGRIEENVFLTCQLPTAESLADRLGSGARASEPDILRYAGALCNAMQAAHDSGHVHGFLLPSDIVPVAGQVKVGGVGLYSDLNRRVLSELWLPFQRYLAPEVLGGGLVGPASDVYSIGAILAELASGQVGQDSTVPLLKELKQWNPPLAGVVAAAVADVPEARPQTPRDLLRQLSALFIDDRVPTAAQPAQPEPIGFDTDDADVPNFEAEMTVAEEIPGGGLAQPQVPSFFQEQLHPPAPPVEPEAAAGAPGAEDDPGRATTVKQPDPDDSAGITSERLELVSMKESADRIKRSTPILPVLDKPGVEPQVKTIPGPPAPEPRDLGRYSRPAAAQTGGRRSRLLLYVAVGIAAAGLASSVVLMVRSNSSDESEPEVADSAPPVTSPAGGSSADAAPALVVPAEASSCGPSMVSVEESGFCIDAFESPGKGRMPQTGISHADAQAACTARGARLCTAREWEHACRGEGGASWPYGNAVRPELCNTQTNQVEVVGARTACRGHIAVWDMTGNVAEWVEEKQIRGGSATDKTDGRCSQRRASPGRQSAYSDVGFRCCQDLSPDEP